MAENFFGITDVGRQRKNNEDAFIAQKIWNGSYTMACVIDGVGGYEGGEVAAQLASETIQHYFSIPSGDIPTMMQEALVAADEKIREEKKKKTHLESMACVVTLALVNEANQVFYYAHVGDTRLYLLRDEALVKISKDHSFVGFLEDNGRITEEEAMAHPKRNEIDKALGFTAETSLKGDYIELGQSPFLPGDALLMCSDGLSDMLTKNEIAALYMNGKSLADKGKALVDAANKKGGKDNITVVLVQNNNKPVKQKRTKPVVVKKNDSPQQKNVSPTEPAEKKVMPVNEKNYKSAFWIVSIACLALAAATGILFWKSRKETEAKTAPVVFVQSESERKLVDTLQQLQGNRLLLSNAVFGSSIVLSDTLMVTKDSLHISGAENTVIEAAEGYTGPALFVPKGISSVFIDSLIIKNFNTGIMAGDATLHLKGVRFINCASPVQFALPFTDSMAVSGVIKNGQFIVSDSTLKIPKQ